MYQQQNMMPNVCGISDVVRASPPKLELWISEEERRRKVEAVYYFPLPERRAMWVEAWLSRVVTFEVSDERCGGGVGIGDWLEGFLELDWDDPVRSAEPDMPLIGDVHCTIPGVGAFPYESGAN